MNSSGDGPDHLGDAVGAAPDGDVPGAGLVVTLVTHGGLAPAAGRRAPRVVEAAGLPPGRRAHLRRLVSAARSQGEASGGDAAGAVPPPPLRRGADLVTYEVTVRSPGEDDVLLRATDADLTDPFADLVDWIEEHAR